MKHNKMTLSKRFKILDRGIVVNFCTGRVNFFLSMIGIIVDAGSADWVIGSGDDFDFWDLQLVVMVLILKSS